MSWRRPQSLHEPDPGASSRPSDRVLPSRFLPFETFLHEPDPGASSRPSDRVLPSRFLPFGTFEALRFQDAPISMWLLSRYPPCGEYPLFYFADPESLLQCMAVSPVFVPKTSSSRTSTNVSSSPSTSVAAY